MSTSGRMNVGQVTSTNGLRTVPANQLDRWIAETLQPSTAFCKQVKQTVKQICDFFKENCFETNIRVHKTVKGGSAGKGTALQNNSDADVVLFLSHFSSYEQQKQERKYILDLIKRRLHACRQSLTFTVTISEPQYKGPGNTPRSVSLTLRSRTTLESIKVDVLPAYDALGQVTRDAQPDMEVYVGLLNARGDPGEFSSCFTELQKKFVKRYPAKLKNLLRLVKHWYKEMLKPQYLNADLPPKYALELLTIYAWEEGTGSSDSFNMAEGFRTVLQLLCRPQEICIYWEMYYSLQHTQIGAHVKNLMRSHCPIILDPADPTGILGKNTQWDLMAQKAAQDLSLLPCINNTQPWDVQPARLVTIEVKQMVGTSLSRTVSPHTTIQQLKKQIEKEWNIPWYKQRLRQQELGRNTPVLQDGETLATYGIFYNTTLVLLQTEPQTIEILVKNDKNQTTTYMVQLTDTVRQLKEKIHSNKGPSADQQYLTYDSRTLEDQHMLAHYDIQPKSTIYMNLKLRGGAGPQNPQFPA
ncbi:2'-5'-oligoadenylate synthase 1 [Tyto alba]|uniref:2'-5'-oligoadenylate synthase 1 n=1 Tax=Tyto alba TaxID=56313 RepID=UPI001C66854A|nr:2'-5'-oligoadenylate synthase 1 [Tyto alba]